MGFFQSGSLRRDPRQQADLPLFISRPRGESTRRICIASAGRMNHRRHMKSRTKIEKQEIILPNDAQLVAYTSRKTNALGGDKTG
jgi:hypothetical protein